MSIVPPNSGRRLVSLAMQEGVGSGPGAGSRVDMAGFILNGGLAYMPIVLLGRSLTIDQCPLDCSSSMLVTTRRVSDQIISL